MAASIPVATHCTSAHAPVDVRPGAGWTGRPNPQAVLGPLRVSGPYARMPLSSVSAVRHGPVAKQAALLEAGDVAAVLGMQHFIITQTDAPADIVELHELRDASSALFVWTDKKGDAVADAWRKAWNVAGEAWDGSVKEPTHPPIPPGYRVHRVYLAWPPSELRPRAAAELARLDFSNSGSLTSCIDCFMPLASSVATSRSCHTPSEVTISGQTYYRAWIEVKVVVLPKPCPCNCNHVKVPHRGVSYCVYPRKLSFDLACASTCSGGRLAPDERSIDELLAAIEGRPAAAPSSDRGRKKKQLGGATAVVPAMPVPGTASPAATTTAHAPPPPPSLDTRLAAATGAVAQHRARLARLRDTHAAELAGPPAASPLLTAATAAADAAPMPDSTQLEELLALEAVLAPLAVALVAADANHFAAMMECHVAGELAPLDAALTQLMARECELEAAAALSRVIVADARARAAVESCVRVRTLAAMLTARRARLASLRALAPGVLALV